MFGKTKKSVAWILTVVMCLSMFSGIVLAEPGDATPAVDAYVDIRGAYDETAYAVNSGVVFIDPDFAGKEGTSFTYTYGNGDTWGDGKTYYLTYGTSAVATVAELATIYGGGGRKTFVFAPGTYTGLSDFSGWQGGCIILGPQAGKTPINNPKKGYEGDNAWGIANNRSANPATEAVLKDLPYRLVWNNGYVFDGVALDDTQLYCWAYTDSGFYTSWEMKNVYWTSSTKALFNMMQADDGSNPTAPAYVFRITDSYIESTTEEFSWSIPNIVCAEAFQMDGVYFKGTGVAAGEYGSFFNNFLPKYDETSANAVADAFGANYSIKNSKVENIPCRGLANICFDDAGRLTENRPAGSVDVVLENNEFIDVSKAGNYTGIRVKTNDADVCSVRVVGNRVARSVYEEWNPFFDVYADGIELAVNGTIENNAFIGYGCPVMQSPASVLWDISRNYFADLEGNMPSLHLYRVEMNGSYLDEACTLHSTEVDAKLKLAGISGGAVLKASAPALNGTKFTGTASINISAASAAVSATFASDDVDVAGVYANEDCTVALNSWADLATGDTCYVKGTYGAYTIVYAATVAGPYDDIRGEFDGVAYQPAANVVFIDPNFADKSASEEFEYVYGNDTWGDGQTYYLTYGTNAVATVAELAGLLSGERKTFVFAPGNYSGLKENFAGWTQGCTILGPQAGKTPINNPKKGYVGNDAWGIANNRSANSATEAVLADLPYRLVWKGGYVFDGIALQDAQLYSWAYNDGGWTSWELKNVYWVSSKQMFNLMQADGQLTSVGYVARITDSYLESTVSEFNWNDKAPNVVCAEAFQMDGVYFKGTGTAGSGYGHFFSNFLPVYDATTAEEVAAKFGANYLIKNSKLENIACRGLANLCYDDAGRSTETRPAGSVDIVLENNEFYDVTKPGNFASIRVKTNAANVCSIRMVGNRVARSNFEEWNPFIDAYSESATLNMDVTIEKNAFIGYGCPVMQASATSNKWDISKNYYADLEGNMPTLHLYEVTCDGHYIDEACTLHSSDVEKLALESISGGLVNEPSSFKVVNGNIFAYATGAINAADAAVSATFASNEVTYVGVYVDESCEVALGSWGDLNLGDTFYVKGLYNDTAIIYAVTVPSPYDVVKGEFDGSGYYPVSGVVFVDPSFADYSEGEEIEYYYGDDTWGDGSMFYLTVGTNAVADAATAVAMAGSVNTFVFAPGEYTDLGNYGAWISGSATFLGPQAGKVPVNNPNKGYNGDAPWSIANGRSADPSTEAVISGYLPYKVKWQASYNLDGFAFSNATLYFEARGAGDGDWHGFNLKNNYWVNNNTAFISTAASNQNTYLVVNIEDCYMESTDEASNWNMTNVVGAEVFHMDGVYMKGTGCASGDVGQHWFTVMLPVYNADIASRTAAFGDNLKIVNSKVENAPLRGFMTLDFLYSTSIANRPAGTYSIVIDNNDFDNVSAVADRAALLIKPTKVDQFSLDFTNNTVVRDDEVWTPFVEVYADAYDVSNNNITIENNVFKGYARPAGQDLYDPATTSTPWDISRNFFGAPDGSAITPNLKNTVATGAYMDEALTIYSDEFVITTAKLSDLVVNAYPAYTISGKLAKGTTLTAADFAGVNNDALTIALYSDAACENAIDSIATNFADKTYYVKASYEGYSVVYALTVVSNYAGDVVTVTLNVDATEARLSGEPADPAKPWETYWEADIALTDEAENVMASEEFLVLDYGMYYANDNTELGKLAAGEEYNEANVKIVSYANDENGLAKVYKTYSYLFTGIAEGNYRYGQFYVTYKVNDTVRTVLSSAQELYTVAG